MRRFRPSPPPNPAPRGRLPLVSAHRGDSASAPENSFAAFSRATRAGADGLEFDVRLAADGVPVVLHDALLDRTTEARGPVRRRTGAALGNVRLRGARRDPQTIPALTEVLRSHGRRGLMFIELKTAGPGSAGFGRKVALAVARAGLHVGDWVWLSFSPAAALAARRALPGTQAGVNCSAAPAFRERGAWRRAGAVWLGCRQALVTPRRLARWKAEGWKIGIWVVDDPRAAIRWARAGVDALFTNNPGRMVDTLKRIR